MMQVPDSPIRGVFVFQAFQLMEGIYVCRTNGKKTHSLE